MRPSQLQDRIDKLEKEVFNLNAKVIELTEEKRILTAIVEELG